jgi:hypothetical protein
MMGDRRHQPPTASSSTSLASLGFSLADRRTGGSAHGAFNFEQFKADGKNSYVLLQWSIQNGS